MSRKQIGNIIPSPEKQHVIDESIFVHLAEVKRDFDNGTLDEDDYLNIDETNFHVNLDNAWTLDFEILPHVKYIEVVSGENDSPISTYHTLAVHVRGIAALQMD